jgi:hypothetical protein
MLSIYHLRTDSFRRKHLIELLRGARAAGFGAVNLAWARFPHSFEPEPAHSLADVAAVDAACAELGLEVIPTSHSFTHSEDLLRLPEFKDLDGGGGSLVLSDEATLAAMLRIARELKAAHPRCRTIHLGGDEIFRYATGPADNGYVVRRGRSALFVDFVNRLAAALRGIGLRLAIWSDMLIRYPERVRDLDRTVLVFYWDYWSEGERVPFVTVGGGLMDTFVLDRAALHGDLRMLLFCHLAREGREIPVGHLEDFGRHWQFDADRTSARSFIYAEWFHELGIEHVAAMLPIPEKGSFLPPVAEKIPHLRGFLVRSRANGGVGWMPCSWGDCWQPIALFAPAFHLAQAIAAEPEADEDRLYAEAARRCGTPWTAAALCGWCTAGAHCQFADILDNNWGRTPVKDRLAWLDQAGLLDEDCARAAAAAERCDALLSGAMAAFPADGPERWAVADMAWRCRLQVACRDRDPARLAELAPLGKRLRAQAATIFIHWWPEAEAAKRVAVRYDAWEEALAAIAT